MPGNIDGNACVGSNDKSTNDISDITPKRLEVAVKVVPQAEPDDDERAPDVWEGKAESVRGEQSEPKPGSGQQGKPEAAGSWKTAEAKQATDVSEIGSTVKSLRAQCSKYIRLENIRPAQGRRCLEECGISRTSSYWLGRRTHP